MDKINIEKIFGSEIKELMGLISTSGKECYIVGGAVRDFLLGDQDFIDIYKVNVVGPYQMIRAVEPYMKKQKFGSVVNVSSIAGKTGIGSSIAYAASKGALNTMTLSLAKALGPEIRVNTVCPGFIGTGWFLDRFGEETFNRIVKDQDDITPLKRAGTTDDIAKSVIFFCLECGYHITGETLISDAGMHLSLPKQ